VRDPLEQGPRLRVERAWTDEAGAEAGTLETIRRLAYLAYRAALQGEGRRLDHRLVAVVQRLQSVLPVERQPALRRTQDRDAPVAPVRVGDEVGDEAGE